MEFGSLEELYKVDPDKSENGIPITIGMNEKEEPIIMMVAESGNSKHKEAQRKFERSLERARHNPERRRQILAQIIAGGLLRGWSGVLDSKGKEVKYSFQNGIDALLKYDKLMVEIIDVSNDSGAYRPEDSPEKDTEKNLERSLNGPSSTEKS